MLWEAVFFLVLLKIPLVYACLVVWWAIRAEPHEELPVATGVLTDTPTTPGPWMHASRRRGPAGGRRGPREGAAKRQVASAGARR